MKTSPVGKIAVLAASLFLIGGCAAERPWDKVTKAETKPAPLPSPDQTANNAALAARLVKLAAQPPAPFEGTGWQPLFDGKSLKGWTISDFAGHGQAHCQSGLAVIEMGDSMSGISWTNDLPKMNYEVALDAVKLEGSDFFCGLTFPVGESWCSLILGGWGGGAVGLSSIDSQDASENETSQFMSFPKDKWYRVRVRVTPKKIEAWLDSQKIIDLVTTDRKISLRYGEIEISKPLGVASYQTTAALREIKLRRLE